MEINITETWRIVKVRRNYVLKQTRLTNGTGRNIGKIRMIEVDRGSYLTVKKALESFVDQVGDDLTEDYKGDIKGYIARLENIYDDNYKRFCKSIKGVEHGDKKRDT